MSKYIKLDDAIKSVADQYMLEASIENPHSCDDIKEWEKVASRVFSDIPTIEVNDGEWVKDEYDIARCSECNCINNTFYRNYCPNCGARMESDEE